MKYLKLTKGVVIASALAMLLSGCFSTKVVGRYKECKSQGIDCSKQIPKMAVSVVFQPATTLPSPSKNGTDLPEVAQAAYIEALAEKSGTAKELRKNLATRISSGDRSSGLRDAAIFDGALIITVSDIGPFNPADRVERTEVEIKFDKLKIRSWNAVQTVYSTVNAGTIQSSRLRGTELSISSPSLPNLPSISGKVNMQSTLNEELAANQRVEDVTPIFDPIEGSIKIIRHGGFGMILTGNTTLHATFVPKDTFTAYPELFSITTTDENGWLEPTKLILNVQTSKVPRGLGDIAGNVKLTYILRHVRSGGETYPDADDVVELQTYEVDKTPVLIPAESFQMETYGLMIKDPDEQMLVIKRPQRTDNSLLCFADYESAQDFLDYLKRPDAVNPDRVGTARVGFAVPPSRDALSYLNLELVNKLSVQPQCQPPSSTPQGTDVGRDDKEWSYLY